MEHIDDETSDLDWLPTFVAATGDPNVKDELLKGMQVGVKKSKLHLDGYNQLPYLTGQAKKSARNSFFYFNDDGDLVAMRYENWKLVFMEQRAEGTLRVWAEPFTPLRFVKMFDLRADPYERADITSNTYYDWIMDHAYVAYGAAAYASQFLDTFKEFPPSQRAATFSIDQAVNALKAGLSSH